MSKIKAGMEMSFEGYEEAVDDPFFEKGDVVIVDSIVVGEGDDEEELQTFDVGKDKREFRIRAYKEDNDMEVDTLYYPGEIEFIAEEEEEEVKPKKRKRKKAAPVEEVEEEAEEDSEEEAIEEVLEEPVKKVTKKAKTTKKKVTKKATKKVAEEEPEEELEELEEEEAVEEKPKQKKTSKKKAATKKAKTVAKAEVKVPARTTEEAEEEDVQHTKTVEELLEDSDALDAAKSLVEQNERTFLTLGGVLCEIKKTKAYISAGYTGKKAFERYIDEELHLPYRIAMYYMTIYSVLLPLGVSEDVIISVGYTKMKDICPIANAENIDELIELVESGLSSDELKATIKTSYVKAKDGEVSKAERIKKVSYNFETFEDNAELVGAAIDRAKELNGSDDTSEAFVSIITEWSDMTEGVEVSLDDAISVLENKYKVSLEIIEE